jgi:hypothetical protein
VKAEGGLIPEHKHGFKNLIQISSCLESQNSLTGNPLSLFTEKFRAAALRKTEGVVFYTDVINTLRDEFLENNTQTPFFVSQYTGREQFVDDARRLDGLRSVINKPRTVGGDQSQAEQQVAAPTPTLLDMLESAEAKVAKPELMSTFVGTFFDSLKVKFSTDEFAAFFDFDFTEHADFEERTASPFIIRVLSKEKRSDNFVTATISRKYRRRNPWDLGVSAYLLSNYGDDEQVIETHDLALNCSMARAQLKVTLTPKYTALQRVVLVVTCAPSVETCYVFEVVTLHMLRDFGKFDSDGHQAVQRWYKFRWDDGTTGLVTKISKTLFETVRGHLEGAAKRLSAE